MTSFASGSVVQSTGALRLGDTVAAINGCVPGSAEEAVRMLTQVEGTPPTP